MTDRRFGVLVAGLGALTMLLGLIGAALTLTALPARGATLDGEMWRFRADTPAWAPGRVCVEYNGTFWPVREAVRRWDASDVWAVTWSSCASQPRSMVVKIRTYRTTERACGRTGTDGATWTFTGGRWVWVPDAVTVWLNVDPSVRAGCFATAGQRAHVASHELGHAFGRKHRTGPRVMTGWVATWPTAADLADADAAY